uniref:Uncharacterized protein n=1 Tax=Anas platyrhynchos platyrhynchos TaxID=8840 RepID=A0A493TBM4_ANAPP
MRTVPQRSQGGNVPTAMLLWDAPGPSRSQLGRSQDRDAPSVGCRQGWGASIPRLGMPHGPLGYTGLKMHRVSYAVSLHDLPARPTAFNRVLQQIRSRPSIKRGTSLHSGSRRAKSGSLEPQKGSPHLVRKAPQDSSLTAILHQHQGRPRSSSTTDTAILLAESGALGCAAGFLMQGGDDLRPWWHTWGWQQQQWGKGRLQAATGACWRAAPLSH